MPAYQLDRQETTHEGLRPVAAPPRPCHRRGIGRAGRSRVADAVARRRPGRLSGQADPHRRPVCRRRRRGHRHPAGQPENGRRAEADHHRRQPPRRGHQHRHGRGRACARGRLHAADGIEHPGRQRRPVLQADLRPRARFHAGGRDRLRAPGRGGARGIVVQDIEGPDRLRPRAPRQAHLRLGGQRQFRPSGQRTAQARERHEGAARALQGRFAGRHGPPGSAHLLHVHQSAGSRLARQSRQAARAGGAG
ncbi:hypothetical protein D3C72_1576320 [compost metagenome]